MRDQYFSAVDINQMMMPQFSLSPNMGLLKQHLHMMPSPLDLSFPLSENMMVQEPLPSDAAMNSNTGLQLASPPPTQKPKTDSTHYFQLLHQPNEKQRKSYRNENRYLLPNPLTVCLAKTGKPNPDIKQGTVTVKLLYDTGEELEDDKKEILSGVKTRALDAERKSQFHLKVVETSERNKFRLQFTVRFVIDKTQYQETILSHCFRVTSNKKSIHVENPKPFALKPVDGDSQSEVEVWIRGKCFTDRANTSVKFGGKEAKVIETEENMLVCLAPVRDDLTEDTTVKIEVTNFHPELGSLPCAKNLTFTYVVNPDRKRKVKRERTSPMNPEEQRQFMLTTGNPFPPQFPEIKMEDNQMVFCPPSPSAYNPTRLEDLLRSENEVSRLMSFFASESS